MALEDRGQGEIGVGREPGADLSRQAQAVLPPGAGALEPPEDVLGAAGAPLGGEILGQQGPGGGETLALGSLAVPGHGGSGDDREHPRSLPDWAV